MPAPSGIPSEASRRSSRMFIIFLESCILQSTKLRLICASRIAILFIVLRCETQLTTMNATKNFDNFTVSRN